jgi:hypothetical protein
MKNLLKSLSLALIFITFLPYVHADDAKVGDFLERQSFSDAQKDTDLTIGTMFYLYFNAIGEGIPDSYKYIDLQFLNVPKSSMAYDALQK